MSEAVHRKLTTIFCTDVVGYSRLLEADEVATLETLKAYRRAMSGLIERHEGRVVSTTGDALLAEFASVVLAYVNRGDGASWVDSHYRFQIRTFWIGLLFATVGSVLSIIVVGVVVLAGHPLRPGPALPDARRTPSAPGQLDVRLTPSRHDSGHSSSPAALRPEREFSARSGRPPARMPICAARCRGVMAGLARRARSMAWRASSKRPSWPRPLASATQAPA